MTSLLLTTLAVTLCAMALLWGLSILKRNASIVDPWWGSGFALVAVTAFLLTDGWEPRRLLLTGMTAVWGVRLSAYLLWRGWGEPEDYRYQAMRATHGARFWWVSGLTVFGLQGVLLWFISLPVQVAQLAPEPAVMGPFEGVGAALWAVGLGFEAVGDWQLARFKADPANRGKVMDRGLWRYTRHPNYFGDALLWWGIFVATLATPGAWRFVLSPLLMTGLLLKVSGVPLLERRLAETRPKYRDYVARTSAFVPWPPRRLEGDAQP